MAFFSGLMDSINSMTAAPPIIKVEAEIEASSERVWTIITDFNNYNWNPAIEKIQAVRDGIILQEGSQYNITCVWNPSEKEERPIRILRIIEKKELVWVDESAPLAVTPAVTRLITPCEGGAKVQMTIQVEITGWAASAVYSQYAERILHQIRTEIDALKIRAEKPS